MATDKQISAARRNIKKAQIAWQSLSSQARSRRQPEGRRRARPGSTGEGAYYHIEVRPKGEFSSFRTQDVGEPGGLERVAGHRPSGSWDTQAWLVQKTMAHPVSDTLVGDAEDVRELLAGLGSKPMHVKGDIYRAHDRPNVPEASKPTPAMKRAQAANIKKAQAARRKKKS